MQWHVGTVEHGQELGFVGMRWLEQAIQGHEVGAAAQGVIEASAKLPVAPGRAIQVICYQIGMEGSC